MEPLRDVEQPLRQARSLPLAKLLTKADIPGAEQTRVSRIGFRRCHPVLMAKFVALVNAKSNLRLTGNFRSSTLIVNNAERLCPVKSEMIAVGEDKDFHIAPR